MDNGKTNSAAYLLKPHGNFPLSIIHYQFSKFHNLFLTQRQFSTPSAVTTQEFSIPTGPMPGKTIFGSNAKTIPGSNSCFMRGANTGISLISKPMP